MTALDSILNPLAPQLKSPWANLQAQQKPQPRQGFIAGANGENVISDYAAGGKYSSRPDYVQTGVIQQPQTLTNLASGGENHLTAWQNGNTKPRNDQFKGMPNNLQTIAQKNLAQSDQQISAFNQKAAMFSWGSAYGNQPAQTATAQPQQFGDYMNNGVRVSGSQPTQQSTSLNNGAYVTNPAAYTTNPDAYHQVVSQPVQNRNNQEE